MKERCILFSDAMVRAILSGTKTQTRRVIKPQPEITIRTWRYEELDCAEVIWKDAKRLMSAGGGTNDGGQDILRMVTHKISPYAVGDILWVRETFGIHRPGRVMPEDLPLFEYILPCGESEDERNSNGLFGLYRVQDGYDLLYRADAKVDPDFPVHWRPSVHMPRWASRITLRVTDVQVQRLQETSELDVIYEGIRCKFEDDIFYNEAWVMKQLWDSMNAKRGYSWDSNPYVWVISFERINK